MYIYDNLPKEIQLNIDNIIIDNYEKMYNKYIKKRMIKEIFNNYNQSCLRFDYCTSNPYDECMEVSNMKFKLKYKKI